MRPACNQWELAHSSLVRPRSTANWPLRPLTLRNPDALLRNRLHCTRGVVVLDGWRRSAWLSRLLSSKAGTAGLLAVLSLALLATFTPIVAPYDPLTQVSLPLMEPS